MAHSDIFSHFKAVVMVMINKRFLSTHKNPEGQKAKTKQNKKKENKKTEMIFKS